ncbi:hypothetical protein INR49_024825 [Caranx melampygus]|nr:hypothetical protein INR49_024825 [Caranx melampygus]
MALSRFPNLTVSVQSPGGQAHAPLPLMLPLTSPFKPPRGKEESPSLLLSLSLHAANRLSSVCRSAQTPGKYPAEPRKHRSFYYITSDRQNCSVDQEMSRMLNMSTLPPHRAL